MKIHWQKLWVKIIFWLGAEILLTSIRLDNLADYSEFLSQQKEMASIFQADPTLTVNFVD
ncbi:MAG: hypothetical protein QNJ32_07380 [Xenococcaceae cyanobacterium MO_167.B27]|nr:hypothetical protein [Xenococcaceae cyanobacterium MO_167.B27]